MSYFIIVIISINDMFTSIWTINLGFLKLANFGSAIAHLRGDFSASETSFVILDWTCYHLIHSCQFYILN